MSLIYSDVIKSFYNSTLNKKLQIATIVYQFGEWNLVYNVNVCILQYKCVECELFAGNAELNIGAVYEPRRKVTKNFNCGR